MRFYPVAKRITDLILSLFGLLVTSPITLPVMILVWMQDWHSPFYIAERVGKDFEPFKMVKLRTMVKNADSTGVDSTSSNDLRITKIGHFIRKFKLDELTQLINVFIGDMSLVGPRPNVKRDVDLYTLEEKKLLTVKPGITDFASIVFADEGEILLTHQDPDLAYNQLIRPGKSRLGLHYIQVAALRLDFKLLINTLVVVVSREKALLRVSRDLSKTKAANDLITLALRKSHLQPAPPPGSNLIVTSRDAV